MGRPALSAAAVGGFSGGVALTATQNSAGGDRSLHVDHFGLSIGVVSVGLPPSCTADDVYARYLDLVRLLHRGPASRFDPPNEDVAALSAATGADDEFVIRRLRALQETARHRATG